jgi:hypothetical protein
MSWPFRRRCAPEIGTAIVTRSLYVAAQEYAACLRENDEIIESVAGPEIRAFRALLPAALIRRGLMVTPIDGGWRVVRSPFPALPRLAAECATCHVSIFHCGHGSNVVVFDATAAAKE